MIGNLEYSLDVKSTSKLNVSAYKTNTIRVIVDGVHEKKSFDSRVRKMRRFFQEKERKLRTLYLQLLLYLQANKERRVLLTQYMYHLGISLIFVIHTSSRHWMFDNIDNQADLLFSSPSTSHFTLITRPQSPQLTLHPIC